MQRTLTFDEKYAARWPSLNMSVEETRQSMGGTGQDVNRFRRRRYYNSGGNVDSIPAMLTPGEFVMNAETVKTTGIFCRPVCTARKPKPENVEFYDTPEEALNHGYRPCKVCNPLEHENATPEHIKILLEELDQNPYLRIRDHDLRLRGIEPSHIRRWFKKHHGITFQAHRMPCSCQSTLPP